MCITKMFLILVYKPIFLAYLKGEKCVGFFVSKIILNEPFSNNPTPSFKEHRIFIRKELYGGDTFRKKVQLYHLTSADAEVVAVRSVNAPATLFEESGARIILHCMHICETAPNTTHTYFSVDMQTLTCWFYF